MIVPQNYPLYAASVFMASDAGVKAADRTCQHNPDDSNVEVTRVIAWDVPDSADYLPVAISEKEGRLVGYRVATYETWAGARAEAARVTRALVAFWRIHGECDGTCNWTPVQLGAPLTEKMAREADEA